MKKWILAAAVFAVPAWAQPQINAALNNASYALPGLLNSGIAQGSMFAVFGTGFAPEGTSEVVSAFPLQTSMAGVSLKVTLGTTSVDALMIYVTPGQVGAIMPSGTPLGTGTMTLKNASGTSKAFSIQVVQRSFGIFTLNQSGTGPAVIQNFESADNQPVNTVMTPAKPGQVVTLWGTGLGPVSAGESTGPAPGDLHPGLRLSVGSNQNVSVLYAGRSGCCAGVDQVQFVVPPDTLGCYVPVVLYGPSLNIHKVTDIAPQSNFATMSISEDGKPCTDPSGLTGEDIAHLQQKGSLGVGSVLLQLWHPFLENVQSTTLAASFSKLDPNTFLRSRGIFGYPALNTCLSYPIPKINDSQSTPGVLAAPLLDAGVKLTVQGPGGTLEAARGADGGYSSGNAPTSQFSPGSGHYTLSNGSGGKDVGAFQVGFDVPPLIQWTNKQQIASFQVFGSNVPFQWTGADPNSFVVITSLGYNNFIGAFTMCTTPGDSGKFSLETLPSVIVGIDGNFGGFPNIFGLGTVSPVVRFSAPGLDAGLLSVMLVDGVFVP